MSFQDASRKVSFYNPFGDSAHWQQYYLLGLRQIADLHVYQLPWLPRRFRLLRKYPHLLKISGTENANLSRGSALGRYILRSDSDDVRFAIDTHDSIDVWSREALAWSDVYFNASMKPGFEYSPKVAPIVLGSGNMSAEDIAALKDMRDTPKDIDVSYVWLMRAGIEHNVRILEQLSQLECRKDLLAIFIWIGDKHEEYVRRLDAVGVAHTEVQLPTTLDLWRRLARSKVVVVRAAKRLTPHFPDQLEWQY